MGFCEQILVAQIEHQKIRCMHENITFRRAYGTIRTEIRLDAERTKNNHARTIFVPKQMQRQLKNYLKTARKQSLHLCSD